MLQDTVPCTSDPGYSHCYKKTYTCGNGVTVSGVIHTGNPYDSRGWVESKTVTVGLCF